MKTLRIVSCLIISLIIASCSNSSPSADFKIENTAEGGADSYTYGWDQSVEEESDASGLTGTSFSYNITALEQNGNSSQVLAYNDRNQTEEQQATKKKPANNPNSKAKIIKEAQMGIQVDDYAKSRADIETLIPKYNAYVADENERKSDYYIQNTLVLRLPSEYFDEFMNQLSGVANKIDYKRVNAQDVTRQYVDIKTRLETKKTIRKKYESFMSNAKNVEDMLAIEEKIRYLTEEIEAKEAELRYLSDRVSYSTITLDITQRLPYKYESAEYHGPSFTQRMGAALGNGWKGVQNFAIGMTSAWPFWLFVISLGFLLRKPIKRIFSKKS